MENASVVSQVTDLLLNKRQYAAYFDFRGDRKGTEVCAVLEWMHSRHRSPGEVYSEIRHCGPPNDPPDVVATTHEGKLHGFEVTELVDAEQIRRCERHEVIEFKEYSESDLLCAINERIARKSTQPFKTSCDKSILLIYSDEPDLDHSSSISLLTNITVPKIGFFSEIWLMIPPEINISGGPSENPHCQIFPIRQK